MTVNMHQGTQTRTADLEEKDSTCLTRQEFKKTEQKPKHWRQGNTKQTF